MSPLYEKLYELVTAGIEDARFIPLDQRREIAALYLAEATMDEQVSAYMLESAPLEFDQTLALAYRHAITGNQLSVMHYLDLRFRFTWQAIAADIDSAMDELRTEIAAEQEDTDTVLGRAFAETH